MVAVYCMITCCSLSSLQEASSQNGNVYYNSNKQSFPVFLNILFTPHLYSFYNRKNASAIIRDIVFHPGRYFRKYSTFNDTVFFQLSQLVNKHLFTDMRNYFLKCRKTITSLIDTVYHQHFPFATYFVKEMGYPAIVRVKIFIFSLICQSSVKRD